MADRKEPAREAMRRTARRRRENPAEHRRLSEALNPQRPKSLETDEQYERRQRRPTAPRPVRRIGIDPRTGNYVLDPRAPEPRLGPGGEIGVVIRRRPDR